jgi:hypothetical protein
VAEGKGRWGLALPLTGSAKKLKIVFIDHPKPGRPDRMAEAFEASVYLTGDRPISVEKSVTDILPGLALF